MYRKLVAKVAPGSPGIEIGLIDWLILTPIKPSKLGL